MRKWFEQTAYSGSHVIYSRIRLSRNWDEHPFPARMDAKDRREAVDALVEGLSDCKEQIKEGWQYRDLSQVNELERQSLRERRILNGTAAAIKEPAGLLVSEDESKSAILCGDDHIRLQLLSPGLKLDELWREADRLDDWMNEKFSYAFDEKYGYLTAFPTNVGTGLKACAVVHLPALSRVKKFQSVVSDMARFGTVIRSIYGEGGDNYGSFYEISNQRTLGLAEREIVELVTKAALQLNNQENRVEKAALSSQRKDKEDEAYKSYGVLKYARKISEKDARIFLSILMEAEASGLLHFKEPVPIYSLILGSKPANLRMGADRPLDQEELDEARAAFIRQRLPELSA